MFSQEFEAVVTAARGKSDFLKNRPWAYLLASILAGAFIGFGVILSNTAASLAVNTGLSRIVSGLTFAGGLSLVVFAGAELFTGNHFTIGSGMLAGRVSLAEGLKVLAVCMLGNWLGSILVSILFAATGLADGALGEFMATSAKLKMALPVVPLITRAVLCNILVCLAIWCTFRLKSETAKLVMIFWCLFIFVTAGFEHSVANMTLLTTAMLGPYSQGLTLGGYFYNILLSTLGNLLGGIWGVALPYYLLSREKK